MCKIVYNKIIHLIRILYIIVYREWNVRKQFIDSCAKQTGASNITHCNLWGKYGNTVDNDANENCVIYNIII